MSEGFVFSRYVDDYCIFCASRQDAYQRLARLANILYESHGLTLQVQKTKIYTSEEYIDKVLETDEKKEVRSLAESFKGIVYELGLITPYEPFDYEALDFDQKEKIDCLNLEGLLDQQLELDEIDIRLTKYLINRLGQLQQVSIIKKLLSNLDALHPVFPEIVRYLARLVDVIPETSRARIGDFMLRQLTDTVISQLDFHRMLIMSLFAGSNKWGNADRLPGLYSKAQDTWFKGTLFLAMGKSGQSYWLRAKKSEMEQMPLWERRAFLCSASCLPRDERQNYYRAVRSRLDNLEKYVLLWAEDHPINE